MPSIAGIVRKHGPQYLERFGAGMPPSHARALADIASCRTPQMGGHLLECDDCGHREYVYHSCRNRACPRCHARETAEWTAARVDELLPVRRLSPVFRAKFAAQVRRELPGFEMPGAVWRKRWVVFSRPCLEGGRAVLGYLARYVRRGPLGDHAMTCRGAGSAHRADPAIPSTGAPPMNATAKEPLCLSSPAGYAPQPGDATACPHRPNTPDPWPSASISCRVGTPAGLAISATAPYGNH